MIGLLMTALFWLVSLAIVCWISLSFLKFYISNNVQENRAQLLHELGQHVENPIFLGFFHPYCNAGGGGERVLWTAIRDIQKEFDNVICVIYTGDLQVTKTQIINKVKNNFAIELNPNRLCFVYLTKRHLIEDSRYPRFTLILQSLASVLLGYEAISQLVPDIYFDTMGYAFTYPLVHYFTQVKIATYTHYPTISSDMVNRVYERKASHNNSEKLASNIIWSTGKLIYYRLFALVYGFCGSFAQVVMTNSTWTKNHIDQLWNTKSEIVYPPCDTERLASLPLKGRQPIIVSVAQFRPEKDHSLQLKSLARLFEKYPEWKSKSVKLVLIGSSRNEGDANRIDQLKKEANQLGIQDSVQFEINAPYDLLVTTLGKAKIGLHTMWNEHFGIGVVEYMAAGLIPVAHNSGGPKLDIVTEYDGKPTGFLADNADSFADSLNQALLLNEDEYEKLASNARASASDKFSEEAFSSDLLCCLRPCLT